MKQLVQYPHKVNNILHKSNIVLLFLCFVCLLTACRDTREIVLYYKTGYVETPISKSFESFEDEMYNHPVDTIIYVKAEDFQRYCVALNSIKNDEGSTNNIHDYYICINYEGKNIAIRQPIPESLNGEIITYTKQMRHGKINSRDLYKLLCSARYFDFFTEDEMIEHPLVRKFHAPSDYKYFWSSDSTDIPLKIKSRYKVILTPE